MMTREECHYKENGIGPSAGALKVRKVLLKAWTVIVMGGVIAAVAGSIAMLRVIA